MNDGSDWIKFIPILFVMAIGICTPFVIVIVALVFVRRRKINAATSFSALADSLGGRLHSSPLNVLPMGTGRFTIQGQHHGIPYRLSFSGGGGHQPMPYITLVVPVRPSFTLSLRKENLDTRLSKRIGIASELEIGVPDFDAEYYIRTNDPTSCREYLSQANHREAIKEIHRLGFVLAFTRKHILLRKNTGPGYSPDTNIVEETEIRDALNAVTTLVQGWQH